MNRFAQISTVTMFALLTSSAFVATAEAGAKKVWCEQSSSFLFRTACELQIRRQEYTPPSTNNPGQPAANFRSRSDEEMALRAPAGGGENGGAGGSGGKR